MKDQELNHLLDESLARLQAGESLEAVLARNPEWAADMRPILESVMAVWQTRGSDTVPVAAMVRSRERLLVEAQRRRALEPRRSPLFAWLSNFRAVTVSAVILVVVLTLGITGLSSLNALPGDPFYPMKLAAETFTLSLPVKASVRLAWQDSYDLRRRQEVEGLIGRHSEVEVHFTGHLTKSEDGRWMVDEIPLVVTDDRIALLEKYNGRFVYVVADLLPDGQAYLEGIDTRLYEITGEVRAFDGTSLRVDDVTLLVTNDTLIDMPPTVGDAVTVTSMRTGDGGLLALWIGKGPAPQSGLK